MKLTKIASLLSLGLLALAPAAAQAKATTKAFSSASVASVSVACAAPSLSTALSAFGDTRSYFLVPGGDFETAARGWTLTGGAGVVPGSSPLVAAAKSSLQLSAGASATSPTFCVDLDSPTFRFFAAQVAATSAGRLSIDMIYPDNAGQTPVATTISSAPATLTLGADIALPSAALNQAGGLRRMQLRFRATAGTWLVDDVLIDPRMRS